MKKSIVGMLPLVLTSALLAQAEDLKSVGAVERPNVIVVMTDDQGYGDLSCHGNPILKTPELDKLHAESIRFTDFHVSPFCTPTRASLMTGQHAGRTGAYRTTGGLSLLYREKKTIANLFADNGYATGMFGKWHLGDNAPQRPQDKGFQDVVWHRCGGIGQGSDYWGNDYFDDTFERVTPGSRTGAFEKFEGYCTDVFFREASRFVEQNTRSTGSGQASKPFFLYLSLNAPHGPFHVAPEWEKPYKGNKAVVNSAFYGMIANIDWNMGIFRKHLDELGLAKNTIFIFMTDNGTSGGGKFSKYQDSQPMAGYNAGMRGRKSSLYEGGQRVPFFIYWPEGELTGGKDVETLAAHLDVLPTLAELCGIDVPKAYDVDGLSLVPLLKGETDSWPRDHLVIQHHGGRGYTSPLDEPFADTVVLTEKWRLVNSWRETPRHSFKLYDMETDFAQKNDVSQEHPEVVERLKGLYQPFWEEVSPVFLNRLARIDLGNPDQNPTELCAQDWVMDKGYPPYSFKQIRKLPKVTAPWMVHVTQAGRYRFTLRQWPDAANKPLVAVRAKVSIAGQEQEVSVPVGSKGAVIELDLPAGPAELITFLYNEKGEAGGAYFTEVEYLNDL